MLLFAFVSIAEDPEICLERLILPLSLAIVLRIGGAHAPLHLTLEAQLCPEG